MDSPLQKNITNLQSLLDKINSLPDAGGVELPELSNEGSSSDLLLGKQLINQQGQVVSGEIKTYDGSYECSDDKLYTVNKWTGTIEGNGITAQEIYTFSYSDESLTLHHLSISLPDAITISVAANTMICFHNVTGAITHTNIEIIVSDAESEGIMVCVPTADNFSIILK